METDLSLRESTAPFISKSTWQTQSRQGRGDRKWTSWTSLLVGMGLLITTIFSVLLLASTIHEWTFPTPTFEWIVVHRATVQFILQLLSNALALVYVSTFCHLINRATRTYWHTSAPRLDTMRFWHGLCMRAMDWNIPVHLMLLLAAFILITAAPSAIWAGALTPVSTTTTRLMQICVPGYQNTSNLREWPLEVGNQGPILRSPMGMFTYSVGVQLQADLLTSASSATSVDGSERQHAKFDNSRYTYLGPSYGVGASVGLTYDGSVNETDQMLSYTFQETGFSTKVICNYNHSTNFILTQEDTMVFDAMGTLPNSANQQFSRYFGYSMDAIVAIGVAQDPADSRRVLAIAAGNSYQHLNATQCEAYFTPTLFNITAYVSSRTIRVDPLSPAEHFISSSDNLTQTLMRQFELIANTQTNLYMSLVGDSLNTSISDYMTAHSDLTSLTLENATLPGLQNSIAAIVDAMLVAYASAQLMIQHDCEVAEAMVTSIALRVGEEVYIYAIFFINIAILLVVAIEVARTKAWKNMVALNYVDPGVLISASTAGAFHRTSHEDECRLLDARDKHLKVRLDKHYIILEEYPLAQSELRPL